MTTHEFDPMGLTVPLHDVEALRRLAESLYHHIALLHEGHLDPVAVEVGTWAGGTAKLLADIGYRVFTVDHWKGNPNDALAKVAEDIGQQRAFKTFCQNVGSRLYRNVFPLIGTSLQHAAVWPHDLPIDLLFLDANHAYEYIRADIEAWSSLVHPGGTRPSHPGGIISGHDFSEQSFPGVVAAVKQTGPYMVCEGSTVWHRTRGEAV